MKLNTRIKLICFGMAAAITILSACFVGIYSIGTIRKNTEESARAVTNQTVLVFDNVIKSMNKISLAPVLNPSTYSILKKKYNSTDLYKRYQAQDEIASQTYNDVYDPDKHIFGVTYISLCSDLIVYQNNAGYSPSIKNLKEQDWYLKLTKSGQCFMLFSLEKDQMYPQCGPLLCFARIIKDAVTDEALGVIRVDVYLSGLEYIWNNAKLCDSTQMTLLVNGMQMRIVNDQDQSNQKGKYINLMKSSDAYDYVFINKIPASYFYRGAGQTIMIIFLAAFVIILLSFYISDLLTIRIMEPIRDLNDCMKTVREGNLEIRAAIDVGGEFGEVCESFNLMVDNTQQLINQIYEEENKKRKAEFQALQAQISPHFLLNTINTMKWMAVLQGNKSIANALEDLAKILSYTFRDAREKISIKDEVEQLTHYIHILSLRYPNRFHVDFNIEEGLDTCLTLKYSLQPFLENSIFHGFDSLDREGVIVISIKRIDNVIEYNIWDNGKGMEKEIIEQVFNREEKVTGGMNSIGIYNVVKRIKMVYGEAYGVYIESVIGEFTNVRIRIPVERTEEVGDI